MAPTAVAADLLGLGFRVRIRRGYSPETEMPGHRVLIAVTPEA